MPRPNLPSMMSRRPARLLSTMLPHISHTPRISHQPLSPRLSPIPHPTPYIVQHIHPVPSVSAIKPSILVNMFTTSELRRLVNMNSACMHTSPYPFRRMHFPMTYLSCIPLHTESVFSNTIIIEKTIGHTSGPPPAWATPYYCHGDGDNSSGSVHMRGQSCQAIFLSSNQQITSSPCCRIRSLECPLQIYLPRHNVSESIRTKHNAMTGEPQLWYKTERRRRGVHL